MPALSRRLRLRGRRAGIRKPPRKETASRKGAVAAASYGDLGVAGVCWLGVGEVRDSCFRRMERSEGEFSVGDGIGFFTAKAMTICAGSRFVRAGPAPSSDPRRRRDELQRCG